MALWSLFGLTKVSKELHSKNGCDIYQFLHSIQMVTIVVVSQHIDGDTQSFSTISSIFKCSNHLINYVVGVSFLSFSTYILSFVYGLSFAAMAHLHSKHTKQKHQISFQIDVNWIRFFFYQKVREKRFENMESIQKQELQICWPKMKSKNRITIIIIASDFPCSIAKTIYLLPQ